MYMLHGYTECNYIFFQMVMDDLGALGIDFGWENYSR
jgi:hypothetical protein